MYFCLSRFERICFSISLIGFKDQRESKGYEKYKLDVIFIYVSHPKPAHDSPLPSENVKDKIFESFFICSSSTFAYVEQLSCTSFFNGNKTAMSIQKHLTQRGSSHLFYSWLLAAAEMLEFLMTLFSLCFL